MLRASVLCYTHYPTISNDMLGLVADQRPTYNNSGRIARNKLLSYAKLQYYRAFAALYGRLGRCTDGVMVNSSWTKGHLESLWPTQASKMSLVYPPCDVSKLVEIPLQTAKNPEGREHLIVSVGQFRYGSCKVPHRVHVVTRPEKNHAMQLEIFAACLQRHPVVCKDLKLILVGGCRSEDDEQRVRELKRVAKALDIEV